MGRQRDRETWIQTIPFRQERDVQKSKRRPRRVSTYRHIHTTLDNNKTDKTDKTDKTERERERERETEIRTYKQTHPHTSPHAEEEGE